MSETSLSAIIEDVKERLSADSYFSDISVFSEKKGDLLNSILKSLGMLTTKGGKFGVCVVVMSPTASDQYPEGAASVLELTMSVRVLENVLVNTIAATGTLKAAIDVARRIVKVLKMYRSSGIVDLMMLEKQCIVPVADDIASIAYEARFKLGEVVETYEAKVVAPTITPAGTLPNVTVTLASTTSSSSIYYTKDGTYPRSGNATATLYTIPFAVTATCTVRAGATKSGMIDSDISSATI
jgi:hypothetical protein